MCRQATQRWHGEDMSSAAVPISSLYSLHFLEAWRAFRQESLAFWLVCAYIFFEYVRPQTIYPAMDVLPYAQLLILGALGTRIITRERFDVWSPLAFLLLCFLGVLFLSWAAAYRPELASDRVTTHVVWVIVFFLVVSTVSSEHRFFMFLALYLLWNFKMSQHGMVSWVQRGFGYADWGVAGAPGWFSNSGEFGIQMCIFLPMSIYFIVALKPWWGRWKVLIMSLLPVSAAATILATNSRGAVVGAVASFAWIALQSRRRLRIGIVLAVIMALGYSLMPEQTLERFSQSGEDDTSQARLERWAVGLEIMDDHPWLGVGPNNWLAYYRDHYLPIGGGERWGLPHSIFIDAGAEFGYTGLALFLLMILYCFVLNRRTRRLLSPENDRFLYYTASGFDAALVGMLVSAAFVSVFFYPYFWIHAAMIAALYKVARARARVRAEAGTADSKGRAGVVRRFPAAVRPGGVQPSGLHRQSPPSRH